MADILYAYKDNVYVNLTNKCPGNCVFCVRNKKDGVGGAELVLEREPTLKELEEAVDAYDFSGCEQLVFCGYGEPTCAVDNLIALAKYFRKNHKQKIRVNTNGLGRLYHKRDILPELCEIVDSFSVSLNAPNAEKYDSLVRPPYVNAFDAVLDFAVDAKAAGKEVAFSVVTILSEPEIEQCRKLADELGIPLRVRQYDKI